LKFVPTLAFYSALPLYTLNRRSFAIAHISRISIEFRRLENYCPSLFVPLTPPRSGKTVEAAAGQVGLD
jgi:hypothetical protein